MANHQPTPAATGTTANATSSSQTSKQSSASNSVAHSPMGSRDPSPTHPLRRATSSGRLSSGSGSNSSSSSSRSRQNSQQDLNLSPSRQIKSPLAVPSTTSATRSLSATSTPTLLPATQDFHTQAFTPQKPILSPETRDNARWPVSPRLRSPPPQLHRIGSLTPRQLEPEPPLVNVQRPSPSQQLADLHLTTSESEAEDLQMPPGLRTPSRGPLETVQEVSQPNSPARAKEASLLEHVKEKLPYSDHQSDSGLNDGFRTVRARPILPTQDNGSDSGSARLESRRTTSVPPPLLSRRSSAILSKQAKSRAEGSTQTMTVETETVTSIPQVALTTSSKTDGINGTLKTKPSTETIKPKREKKKSTRKQPVTSGNASSKADIFEAKIASAVDEANTSDSEETFVYDSNPPDTGDRTTRRFHSRTPSATSMASQADRQNLRSIYGVLEGHVPVPKKSMKFANTFNSNGNDSLTTGDEDGRGTGRSIGGSARGTVRQHHHIGRWGRQPGNGHASLFDNESPFPNASRPKLPSYNSRNSSGPPSPRIHHSTRGHLSSKRSVMHISSGYDLDDTTGADDERTPLLENGRSGRGGRFRRGPHSLRQAESQTYTRRSSYLNRFAACLVLTMMFLLVITGVIGFMFATSQPMTGIEIVSIHDVVTSEQVLLFDVTVKAHNPNIVVVMIDHANLEIFAKSEHAGADSDWWKRPNGPKDNLVRPLDDPDNDPPTNGDDDDDSKPNVLLGRITEFDSPLTFEGSLFHQGTSSSTGQLQLPYPGNDTAGGSKRWERIYQNEFDLIIKGVVKYSLPLSARIRTATVSGRTTVKPNSANDPSLRPNTTAPAIEEDPEHL